ncbi:NAD(P)-binding protein, partial [Stenotrophomonas maltophilia]|uniref:NAD(P)-binding protein n=1 Tax=Stenotrophomonas maltophilia TaxID=40324 RepID=UPI001952A12E
MPYRYHLEQTIRHAFMSALRPLSIGIAGAGNAGLAAAIAFARQGHDVHVFEKHPQLTAMG